MYLQHIFIALNLFFLPVFYIFFVHASWTRASCTKISYMLIGIAVFHKYWSKQVWASHAKGVEKNKFNSSESILQHIVKWFCDCKTWAFDASLHEQAPCN
jgi:hypothetical protein